MIGGAAAFVAWAGACAIVVSDARRGLAAGTALAAVGLALASVQESGWVVAAILAAGGAAAAGRRYAAGPAGWRVLPPGSTPRLVLAIAAGLIALWVGVSVMSGSGGGLRFAVLSVVGLAGCRLITSDDPWVAQTAVAVIALAVAAGAGLGSSAPGVWPSLAGAVVAAAAVWTPYRTPRAA